MHGLLWDYSLIPLTIRDSDSYRRMKWQISLMTVLSWNSTIVPFNCLLTIINFTYSSVSRLADNMTCVPVPPAPWQCLSHTADDMQRLTEGITMLIHEHFSYVAMTGIHSCHLAIIFTPVRQPFSQILV